MRGRGGGAGRGAGPSRGTGARRSAGPSPGMLRAAATAATAAGLALILGVTAGTVNRTRHDAASDIARMAAALWELPGGGAEAVTAFLEDRATIEAAGAGRRATRPRRPRLPHRRTRARRLDRGRAG